MMRETESDYLDLDAYWDAHPEQRPPEHLVLAEMRKMGIPIHGEQGDMFLSAQEANA